MAEEIISLLVKIPDLKVIGRTSSFQFKGKAGDSRQIGDTLRAAYLVEGSVRRSGTRVRVTAQLVDTRDGTQRWADRYDRAGPDVLTVQDEITAGVVRALQLELIGGASGVKPRALPSSPEAYDAYLRGLHSFKRFDEQGFDEAAADFKRELVLDPLFVPAAEQLARTYCDQPSWRLYRLRRVSSTRARPPSQSSDSILIPPLHTRFSPSYIFGTTGTGQPRQRRQASP